MLIGFIGAPSCGKTTAAFGLCYYLKQRGYAVEFFAEYARKHIMECRIKGVAGNGGYEGQTFIYEQDAANALLYREYSDSIAVTDGCTVNCYFYNDFNHIDLLEESRKYDMLFYLPTIDVPIVASDANRMQDRAQILNMARHWEEKVRPLMQQTDHIVEVQGYPHFSCEEVVQQIAAHLEARFFKQKIAA